MREASLPGIERFIEVFLNCYFAQIQRSRGASARDFTQRFTVEYSVRAVANIGNPVDQPTLILPQHSGGAELSPG
jgi:hypothetical protein